MFYVLNEVMPGEVEKVETHEDVKTIAEAKKILKQWMENTDKVQIVAEFVSKSGKYNVQTLAIFAMNGEAVDIFGQLYTKK